MKDSEGRGSSIGDISASLPDVPRNVVTAFTSGSLSEDNFTSVRESTHQG